MKQQILELLQEELTFSVLISKLDNKDNVGLDISSRLFNIIKTREEIEV